MTNMGKLRAEQRDSVNEVTPAQGNNGTGCTKHGDILEKSVPSDIKQSNMYQNFQNWAIKNYGDSGKTKTVTRNKYQRIVRILSGEEQFTAENSKFRFWVKAKGFRLSSEVGEFGIEVLLVPSKPGVEDEGQACTSFKRVAVVENFFDIIYNVHVEMDGRGGKHAGQKRTYRAIAETFSFLPREAVTHFLMSCTNCQKRMHVSKESNNSSPSEDRNGDSVQDDSVLSEPTHENSSPNSRASNKSVEDSKMTMNLHLNDNDNESVSSQSVMSSEVWPSVQDVKEPGEPKEEEDCPTVLKNSTSSSNNNNTEAAGEETRDMSSAKSLSPQTVDSQNKAKDISPDEASSRKSSPVPSKVSEGSKGHHERKRRASSESGDSAMTKNSEGKEDEDEDDNDDDDKIPVGQDIDPERLKAFNMFVRLFVDENLDRMVPISKQPKDKVQAILEACNRQFPEFHERSRKRIRTYLKSCRRMRRSKEHNGWEPMRPTPPHLTSAAAESILATACENESQNAKRMRLGLEPLPASAMVSHNIIVTSQPPPSTQPSAQPQLPQPAVTQPQPQPNSLSSPRSINCSTSTDFLHHQPPPTFRQAQEFTPSFFTNGHGTALFRPGFTTYQHPAHQHPAVLPHPPLTTNTTANGDFGPTDLSMKKSSNKGQLSPSEVTAIKQLIAGYRESAAFLYRSADELEQLLLQQN